jgi:hypothetical protein
MIAGGWSIGGWLRMIDWSIAGRLAARQVDGWLAY